MKNKKICVVPGCDRVARRNDLCNSHSAQQRRGVPLKPLKSIKPHNVSGYDYWTQSDKWTLKEDTGCWISHAAKSSNGYPHIYHQDRYCILPRLVLEHKENRKLEEWEDTCHQCDTPACINPAHLEVGDRKRNMQDAVQRNRISKGEQHTPSKLTNEQVKFIKKYNHTTGDCPLYTQKFLCLIFAMSPNAIHNIASGEGWRHIGG